MKVFGKFILFLLSFFVLLSASVLVAQDKQEYEDKLRKHKEDSLRIVAENKQKAMEKQLIDKQNSVRIAYNEGLKLMRVRQDEKAIQSINKAVGVDVEGVEDTKAKAYYLRAFCEKRLRRYNDSITSYEKAIELDSKYTEALHGLGTTYARLGNADKAIESFEKAVVTDPKYDKSYYEMGKVYLENKKDFAKAIANFQKATEANPSHDDAFNALGDVYLKQGNIGGAIQALESAVEVNPKNHLAYFNLASAYNQSSNATKALEAAKKSLLARDNFAPAAFEAGVALKKLKRYDEAKQYFTQASQDRQWRKNAQYEIDLINDELKKGSN